MQRLISEENTAKRNRLLKNKTKQKPGPPHPSTSLHFPPPLPTPPKKKEVNSPTKLQSYLARNVYACPSLSIIMHGLECQSHYSIWENLKIIIIANTGITAVCSTQKSQCLFYLTWKFHPFSHSIWKISPFSSFNITTPFGIWKQICALRCFPRHFDWSESEVCEICASWST